MLEVAILVTNDKGILPMDGVYLNGGSYNAMLSWFNAGGVGFKFMQLKHVESLAKNM